MPSTLRTEITNGVGHGKNILVPPAGLVDDNNVVFCQLRCLFKGMGKGMGRFQGWNDPFLSHGQFQGGNDLVIRKGERLNISALEALSRRSAITIVTDSVYVKDGVTKWIFGWKKNGWKTAAKKPVKNEDLWKQLDTAQARHQVTWEWVKGHAGHPENELADELARAGMVPFKEKSA